MGAVVGELGVIETEQMEYGGVEDVDLVLDGVEAEFVKPFVPTRKIAKIGFPPSQRLSLHESRDAAG